VNTQRARLAVRQLLFGPYAAPADRAPAPGSCVRARSFAAQPKRAKASPPLNVTLEAARLARAPALSAPFVPAGQLRLCLHEPVMS
jgi:hypothetical protein